MSLDADSMPPRGVQVEQVVAPAGAAFIYDARLWHRACPELNESTADRFAATTRHRSL